ncbi:MAG: NUDIX hydrolase [bacterium]
MTWQKLNSKTVYQNRYMTVTEDELITNHGDKVTFGIVHKDPAVWIVPWDGEKLLLIGQYRYAVDSISWEFPAGHAEAMAPKEAARVELKEETGLSAKELKLIGEFWVAPGHLTQIGYVYIALDFTVGKQKLEPSEKGMQTRWVTPTEIENMIQNGAIKDGPTITAYKYFELYLAKHS